LRKNNHLLYLVTQAVYLFVFHIPVCLTAGTQIELTNREFCPHTIADDRKVVLCKANLKSPDTNEFLKEKTSVTKITKTAGKKNGKCVCYRSLFL